MDKLKGQIQQKLAASVIIDKLKQHEKVFFRESWCTQERIIRFTTPFFRSLFSVTEKEKGKWNTGDYVMYECTNHADAFEARCVMNLTGASKEEKQQGMRLFKALMLPVAAKQNDSVLHTWNLTSFSDDPNKLFDEFDCLLNNEIPLFERKLAEKLGRVTLSEEELKEGEEETYVLNKYERSKKAREACLAAHGSACKVCGIDFGKAYGPEFAGKIEVHHIIPLSQIGSEYVVDPVNDLVPVCPNCHTALHSKKDGVYTIEELKKIRESAGNTKH